MKSHPTDRRNVIRMLGAGAAAAIPFVSARAQTAEITIASIAPLTGGFAQYGRELARGTELGVEALNKKGVTVGGRTYKVNLKSYDDKTDPTTVARLTERAATVDGANFIIAGTGSGNAKSVMPVAQRLRVPVLAQWATVDTVYEAQRGNPYLFSNLTPFSRAYDRLWEELPRLQNPRVQTVVMVSPNDELGNLMARLLPGQLQKAGLKHVHTELFPPTSQDMSATVERCVQHKPDIFLINCYTPQIIALFKQMQAVRFFPPVIIAEAPTRLAEALGNDINGVYAPSFWASSISETKDAYVGNNSDFVNAYRAKYKESPPDFVAAAGAANAIVCAMVAAKAGTITDQQALLNAFRTFNGETFFGSLQFGSDGMNSKGAAYADQFQNKQLKLVFPSARKEAAPIHPYPNWKKV